MVLYDQPFLMELYAMYAYGLVAAAATGFCVGAFSQLFKSDIHIDINAINIVMDNGNEVSSKTKPTHSILFKSGNDLPYDVICGSFFNADTKGGYIKIGKTEIHVIDDNNLAAFVTACVDDSDIIYVGGFVKCVEGNYGIVVKIVMNDGMVVTHSCREIKGDTLDILKMKYVREKGYIECIGNSDKKTISNILLIANNRNNQEINTITPLKEGSHVYQQV